MQTTKQKRPCKVCGEVHLHVPFTDCYGGKEEDLPDSLQDYYKTKSGGKNE